MTEEILYVLSDISNTLKQNSLPTSTWENFTKVNNWRTRWCHETGILIAETRKSAADGWKVVSMQIASDRTKAILEAANLTNVYQKLLEDQRLTQEELTENQKLVNESKSIPF